MIFQVFVTLDFGLPCLLLKLHQTRVIKSPLAAATQTYFSPYVDYLIPISGVNINGFMMYSDKINTVSIPNYPKQLYLDTSDPDAFGYVKDILQRGGFSLMQNINLLQSFIASCDVVYNINRDDVLLFYALDDSILDDELKSQVEERLVGLEQAKTMLEQNKGQLEQQAQMSNKQAGLEDDIQQLRLNKAEYEAQIQVNQLKAKQLEDQIKEKTSERQQLVETKNQQARDKLLIAKGIVPEAYRAEFETYKSQGDK